MLRYSLLPFVPLFAALVWAAIVDVRTRRIRNELTFALAVTGILQSFSIVGTTTPMSSVVGLLVGFAIGLAMLLLGGMGGGDLKLLAAVGAWMGPLGVTYTVLGAALIGMIFVLLNAARDGSLKRLLSSTTVLVANTMQIGQIGVMKAVETGRAHVSIGRPLPYAVPVLLGALFVVLLQLGVRP